VPAAVVTGSTHTSGSDPELIEIRRRSLEKFDHERDQREPAPPFAYAASKITVAELESVEGRSLVIGV
jgi:hypothetical protein